MSAIGYQRIPEPIESLSDSETIQTGISLLGSKKKPIFTRSRGYQEQTVDTYHDDIFYNSHDEFGDQLLNNTNLKAIRSGRQRKKQASRSKGSEFQARRKKRRVYFCCISSEIDIQRLYEHMIEQSKFDGSIFKGWRFKLHNDVVHLFKEANTHLTLVDEISTLKRKSLPDKIISEDSDVNDNMRISPITRKDEPIGVRPPRVVMEASFYDNSEWLLSNKSQEVFVFDFGACVFWVFHYRFVDTLS